MSRDNYVHLHVHSEGSFLDGAGRVKDYVGRAAELGQPALAITDHGHFPMAPQFYKECRSKGVEPIIGFEGYFVNNAAQSKDDKERDRAHISILARGTRGYEVLCELNTASQHQYYYKPLLDRPLLEALGRDAQHLTVLSGCAGSQLSRYLYHDEQHPERFNPDAAVEELLWWRETFPHYYIEIMHHGTKFDWELNRALLRLAVKYNVPWVVTNDQHYCHKDDAKHHDVLLAIQTAKDIDDPDRLRFDGSGYWMKSAKQMRNTFRKAGYPDVVFEEGARHAVAIARESVTRVGSWESKTWQIPKFPDVDDPVAELERLTKRGLKDRGLWDKPVYRKAAKAELRTIREVGIEDFLLITRDLDAYAQSVGIRVGPGRGSICGSLVAYAIGIHKIDPIKYQLLFERFLNPARPKMPDIDTDYQMTRRAEVIAYAIDKYGEDNTMPVAQYGTMKVAKAFNSISKAFGVNYLDAQRLNKLIVEEDDEETGDHRYVLPEEIVQKYPEMTEHLAALAGLKSSIGSHPAGLIIADPAVQVRKQVPMVWVPSGKRFVGAYDKKAVEAMGLMKQDLLGLRTLDTIAVAIQYIKERQGVTIEPDDWIPDEEPDDDKVYAMLAAGRTSGVFQMEGPVNQRGCRDVEPKSFEDLVSITSLYRTGPIAAGYPKQFIDNRVKGRKRIEYLHPLLQPILEPTWGVILYQEQVMDIGRVLAGFDMVLVDDIKEAIKDKSSEAMDTMRPIFIKGCKATNDIPEKIASKIWDIIEGYAGYGYNRSHAVAYTMLTYQTARLKYLYPIEFYAALLATVEPDKQNRLKRDGYLRDAINDAKAKVLPADINKSAARTTPHPTKNAVRFGLQDLNGIGEVLARRIVNGRPEGGYDAESDVAVAVNNTKAMAVLRDSGALRSLGIKGDKALKEELHNWQFVDPMLEWRREYGDEVLHPEDVEDGDDVDLIGMIYHITNGTTKTGMPFATWKIRYDVTRAYDIRMWSECQKFWDLKEGSVVRVRGEWQARWLNITVGNPKAIKVLKAVR